MIRSIDYRDLFKNYSMLQNSVFLNRYISFKMLEDYLLQDIFTAFPYEIIGYSELQNPIYCINIGKGGKKILIWSQMHGNESTTTKSLLDLLNLFKLNSIDSSIGHLSDRCNIKIILMLNPDGANRFTRLNAKGIDLNRDALRRNQKETQSFFNCLSNFKPDYCFNMHGQRTIFSVGDSDKPATLSFLAPSYDVNLNVNKNRAEAMHLITAAEQLLSDFIPGQIGKYDDTHNPNCFGDQIQKMGIPTVLFEAGHYPNDYNRNETRKYVTLSLLKMLETIAYSDIGIYNIEDYYKIPMNQEKYMDIIIENVSNSKTGYIGIHYAENLKTNEITFQPFVKSLDDLSHFYAHRRIDANYKQVTINRKLNLKTNLNISRIEIGSKELNIRIKE